MGQKLERWIFLPTARGQDLLNEYGNNKPVTVAVLSTQALTRVGTCICENNLPKFFWCCNGSPSPNFEIVKDIWDILAFRHILMQNQTRLLKILFYAASAWQNPPLDYAEPMGLASNRNHRSEGDQCIVLQLLTDVSAHTHTHRIKHAMHMCLRGSEALTTQGTSAS